MIRRKWLIIVYLAMFNIWLVPKEQHKRRNLFFLWLKYKTWILLYKEKYFFVDRGFYDNKSELQDNDINPVHPWPKYDCIKSYFALLLYMYEFMCMCVQSRPIGTILITSTSLWMRGNLSIKAPDNHIQNLKIQYNKRSEA